MARRNLSRDFRDLAPMLVPLVTKIVLPVAMESLRRHREGGDPLEEARAQLGKGLKKTRSELDEVKDEVVERGQKLYDEARKQGVELLGVLAEKGAALAEDLLEGARPKPRRRFRFRHVLGIAAVVGIGIFLVTRD